MYWGYTGILGYVLGLYRDNGKENGSYYLGLYRGYMGILGYILGLYRDNGKNGSYYLGFRV